MVQNLVQLLQRVVDTFWVGRMTISNVVAAVGVGGYYHYTTNHGVFEQVMEGVGAAGGFQKTTGHRCPSR